MHSTVTNSYEISESPRRKKRAVYNEMCRTVKRIHRGFEKIVHHHTYNVVKGAQNILKSGKDFNAKFYNSMDKLIFDGLEDIDNRLNKKETNDFSDDQLETDDEIETNVLTDYCFGEVHGANYGIRTFLEFEEECDEGSTCAADIDPDSDDESNSDNATNEDRNSKIFDVDFSENSK